MCFVKYVCRESNLYRLKTKRRREKENVSNALCMCVCICVRMYVCVCVCERERESESQREWIIFLALTPKFLHKLFTIKSLNYYLYIIIANINIITKQNKTKKKTITLHCSLFLIVQIARGCRVSLSV